MTPQRPMLEIDGLLLHWDGGVWTGPLLSPRFGVLELILDGDPEQPSEGHLRAIRRFRTALDANIAALRGRIRWGLLYRPIRIAPNREDRVGVQFLHRLSGNHATLILE